jgi:L-iditol 2-dehydrogenase
MAFFSTPPVDGALSEYVVVHEAFAHPVPDSMSDDEAALLEPLSVGVWSCRKAGVGIGTRVLVTGAGAVGLVAMQVARAAGAAAVVVTDVDARRLTMAAELGADSAVDASSSRLDPTFQPDVILECSGNLGALQIGGAGPRARRTGRAGGSRVRRPHPADEPDPASRAADRRHLPIRQHLAGCH